MNNTCNRKQITYRLFPEALAFIFTWHSARNGICLRQIFDGRPSNHRVQDHIGTNWSIQNLWRSLCSQSKRTFRYRRVGSLECGEAGRGQPKWRPKRVCLAHSQRTENLPQSGFSSLGTLITNFQWARWMGRNGRIAVESAFTWDAIGHQVLSVYQAWRMLFRNLKR